MNHHQMRVSAECFCGNTFNIDAMLCAGGVSFFACPSCGTKGSVSEKEMASLARAKAVSVPAMTFK
ncbi:hypothetical protein NRB_10910 [Novosphingobium sp. 11B]